MIPYAPPLADIRFLLTRLIGLENLAALPPFESSVSDDVIEAVLDETAKIASEVFAPLNDVGDKRGAKFANGAVHGNGEPKELRPGETRVGRGP